MQSLAGLDGESAYDVLARAALEGEVFGVSVRVCSLEHLRAMKLAANRDRDRADLEDLRAIHGDD